MIPKRPMKPQTPMTPSSGWSKNFPTTTARSECASFPTTVSLRPSLFSIRTRRFKSEGYFKLSSRVDLNDPKATNETTDAYDSIEWLVKKLPNNNGKVGMCVVSYDGLTTPLPLLHPHPALQVRGLLQAFLQSRPE